MESFVITSIILSLCSACLLHLWEHSRNRYYKRPVPFNGNWTACCRLTEICIWFFFNTLSVQESLSRRESIGKAWHAFAHSRNKRMLADLILGLLYQPVKCPLKQHNKMAGEGNKKMKEASIQFISGSYTAHPIMLSEHHHSILLPCEIQGMLFKLYRLGEVLCIYWGISSAGVCCYSSSDFSGSEALPTLCCRLSKLGT